TLDARFVDAVEAMAKALNDSLLDPGFSPGNASCAPLRHWTSGSTVLNRLMSISDYDTQRGLISFNSSTRHFSSQRVEVVASYNELWSSPVSMLRSAQFDASSGALSKLFHYKGVSLAFPNTFMGFKNQTLISHLGAGPFTKTSIRDSVIDFSTPLFDQSTAVMVPKPPPDTKMWNIFTPLSPSVWYLLLGTLACASVVMWVLAYYSPFSAYNLGLEYAVSDEIWLHEYIWSAIGSFLQQGQDFYPFAMSPRTVMAFWWMFTLIIFGAFTGDLTAHLTVTVTDYPIKTLTDLVSQTAVKPYVPTGTNHYTLLTTAESGIYKQIADAMVVMPAGEYCPYNPPKNDAACINDYTFLLGQAIRHCSLYYMLSETFNPSTVALMYSEDAFYAQMFDYNLQKMHESGLMQRLFDFYWSRENFTDCGKGDGRSTEADGISLEGVSGCLLITGCLYTIGLLILLIELVWTKLGRKRPLDCIIY
uniref:PBPe domain-containing protein n=1 Tax=Macrostomum lignano TaxID=282301 RepID=A0A1I8H6T5_9PLAT